MASLTLKNIPPDLHRKLKARAAEHGRSLNSEAIAALRVATVGLRPDPEVIIARARELRSRLKFRVDERTLRKFKAEGRA